MLLSRILKSSFSYSMYRLVRVRQLGIQELHHQQQLLGASILLFDDHVTCTYGTKFLQVLQMRNLVDMWNSGCQPVKFTDRSRKDKFLPSCIQEKVMVSDCMGKPYASVLLTLCHNTTCVITQPMRRNLK